jgi:hypothetical protein
MNINVRYKVILTKNGEYKKTLHKTSKRELGFLVFHELVELNKKIMFPKRYVNGLKIKLVEYNICIVKTTEPNDEFRTLRDNLGKTYQEQPIGPWTILHSSPYNLEETFWIYGLEKVYPRPTIVAVVKKLVTGAHKKQITKQIIVVHNKLIIYNEEQFDMVICKCLADAQRLHHALAKVAKQQRLKNLIFMGTAAPANIGRMYDVIKEHTKWSIQKIRRTSTRP